MSESEAGLLSENTWRHELQRFRLLLADDDPMIRECLSLFLQVEHDVVGAVADGLDVLRRMRELRPDILVLDISMPGMSGMKVARQLRREGASAKIIFITEHAEPAYVEEAKRIGAQGYVLKRDAQHDLPLAIQQVGEGAWYASPALT